MCTRPKVPTDCSEIVEIRAIPSYGLYMRYTFTSRNRMTVPVLKHRTDKVLQYWTDQMS